MTRASTLAVLLLTLIGTTIPGASAARSVQDHGPDIYSVACDGSDMKNLTPSAGWNSWPAPSPDGRRIAFVTNRDGYDAVYAMDNDGGQQVPLGGHARLVPAQGNEGYYIGQPVWSPDGSKLIAPVFVERDTAAA